MATTAIGGDAIVIGSAALFVVSDAIPPLTHDLDLLVPVDTLQAQARLMNEQLDARGFSHVAGTATYVSPQGASFDLLAADTPGRGDHVIRVAATSVMAFEDLGVLAAAGAVERRHGVRVLAPAALAWSKLLTLRVEKGAKDKLQALALLGEHVEDPGFHEHFLRLAELFSAEAREDALAEAHAALAELTQDYGSLRARIEAGLEWLQRMLA
ncbi:MAG: hypothetical protein ACYCW6_07080 [Candidatus Xenobia bacterium]